MNKGFIHILTGVVGLAWCANVAAATWDVTVGDNFYSPNDLTIEVGDTVRWTATGAMFHDVTADDGSFGSATSSNLIYERTFNSVGEILYYCTVHSTPGRDRNVFMNGRINVVEADTPTISINSGMADAWFNPETNGQGFFVVVWDGLQQMFVSWFTYDAIRPPDGTSALLGEPGHRWLTAQGPYSGDTAMLDIYLTSGGTFDAADPAAATDPSPVGSMSITWSDCNAAELTYDLFDSGLSGTIPIERIVPDNVPLCEVSQEVE